MFLAALLFLASCAEMGRSASSAVNLMERNSFFAPAPLVPIHLEGSIRVRRYEHNYTGELSLYAWRGGRMRILLRAPWSGVLLLDARLGEGEVLLVDYARERIVRTRDGSGVRERWLPVALDAVELGILFTGRAPLALRQSAGPTKQSVALGKDASQVEFMHPAGQKHRVYFAPDGLLHRWERVAEGQRSLRAEFQGTLNPQDAQDQSWQLPRRVRVYGIAEEPVIIWGLRRAWVGKVPAAPTPFFATPEAARGFPLVPSLEDSL